MVAAEHGPSETRGLADRALHRRVRLPDYFVDPIIIEQVLPADDLYLLTVRTGSGGLEQVTVDEAGLRAAVEAPKLLNPEDLFLLVESARIRLAYAFDPHFAVSLSGVDALPHQLEAVYERLLPQGRLRFLLADDPGAGKTIMAGLLIKELRLRAAIERVLILCPAPLTIQWQDELHSKFDEVFERMEADRVKDQPRGTRGTASPAASPRSTSPSRTTSGPAFSGQRGISWSSTRPTSAPHGATARRSRKPSATSSPSD